MILKPVEKQILKLLDESSAGLLLFTVYRKLNIPVGELYSAIERLQGAGMLVTHLNERLFLSEKGLTVLTKLNLAGTGTVDRFGGIPENFKGPRIEINAPYIPRADPNWLDPM